jgi:cyanate permease
MGTTAAKNIMVSVHITDAKFVDLYSTPYLPDSVNKSSTINSNAYARIKLLPPNAEIKITALVESRNPTSTQIITPFVFSDEGVGRFNQSAVILFYVLLVVIFALIYYGLFMQVRRRRTGRFGLVGLIILIGYMGIFYLSYSLIYGVIVFPSINFPSINFPDLNLPDLPPVR